VDSARENNTVACLGSSSSKTFIAVMVIKEQAFKVRHSIGTEGMKTLFFVNSGMSLWHHVLLVWNSLFYRVTLMFGLVNCSDTIKG
jgi:hypothetical protein